ncbi:MAG: hypothetical protein F6K28_35185 [Microcoleus sp. SIO2G3]|nr:hypothetical protein [Microcoleus sp. SIO2G3]
MQRLASETQPTSRYIQTEKTRNRLITRTVEVLDDLKEIDPSWVGIKSLIQVERTGTRSGKLYHQSVCYISSLTHTA